jgi:hypothetical protein
VRIKVNIPHHQQHSGIQFCLKSTDDNLIVKGIPYCQLLIVHKRIVKSPPMEALTYIVKSSLQSEIFPSIILTKKAGKHFSLVTKPHVTNPHVTARPTPL